MNRKEAKIALAQGKKLSHSFFEDNEHIFQKQKNSRIYFKDSSFLENDKFWEFKQSENWDKNWEITN